MRAVLFTTDAVFSLIITAATISVLLYFYYVPQTSYLIRYSEAQSILASLLSTHIGSISNSNWIAAGIAYQSRAASAVWPQYRGNSSRASDSAYGPSVPFLSYMLLENSSVATPTVVADGSLYFSANTVLFAVNAYSGAIRWSKSLATQPSSIAVYNNMLIYSNSTSITALYENNKALAWSTSSQGAPSSQLLLYNGELLYGAGSAVVALYANNGTLAWKNSIGFTPLSLAVINGSIAVRSSTGVLALLAYNGSTLWSGSSVTASTEIATYGNLILFGSGTNACALYINGTQAFCTPAGSAVTGVSAHKGFILYQTGNSVVELSVSGATLWTRSLSTYGSGIDYPVVSDGNVYTAWSNGYLIAENLSSGSVVWNTNITYTGIGYMSLAYGRLYLVAGKRLLVYGSCNANSQDDLFSAALSLYLNASGSCATYLLNSLYPLSNYTLFINSTYLPGGHFASLNGRNSYMSIPGSASLSGYTNGISYVVWFRLAQLGANQGIIEQGPNPYIYIWFNGTSNRLMCEVANLNAGQGGAADAYTPFALSPNRWYQVALVYNITFRTLYCYLNGALAANLTKTVVFQSNTNPIVVGSYNGYLNGNVADLQIYNKVLNSSQISSLYQRGAQGGPLKSSGLVAWYPLDGDTNDYSGVNNTAYPINLTYTGAGYRPTGLTNAYQIAKASTIITLSSQASTPYGVSYSLNNAGVYAWR